MCNGGWKVGRRGEGGGEGGEEWRKKMITNQQFLGRNPLAISTRRSSTVRAVDRLLYVTAETRESDKERSRSPQSNAEYSRKSWVQNLSRDPTTTTAPIVCPWRVWEKHLRTPTGHSKCSVPAVQGSSCSVAGKHEPCSARHVKGSGGIPRCGDPALVSVQNTVNQLVQAVSSHLPGR